jgi:hypothetical protein
LPTHPSNQKHERNLKITFTFKLTGAHGNAVSLSKANDQKDHSSNNSATAPRVER